MGQWLAARGRFVCSPSYDFPPDSSIGIAKVMRDSTRKGERLKDSPFNGTVPYQFDSDAERRDVVAFDLDYASDALQSADHALQMLQIVDIHSQVDPS